MVTVVKRKVKGITYFYLEHTSRRGSKFEQKSRYLGRSIPKDIARIKGQFTYELNKEKWFDRFDSIRRNYRKELSGLPESAREKQLRGFSVRFTYDTQRIEGSTLTLGETAQLLERGTSPSGKPRADVVEAEAHNRLVLGLPKEKRDLSLRLALNWNWELLKDTKPDVAGQVRRHGVAISGSEFVPPTPVELRPMLDDFFRWYARSKGKTHPVELAALIHQRFVTIHPFADGNGRVSRLMMNYVLDRNQYPMFNVEYRDRNSYYRALERSQVRGEESIFANWLFRRYLKAYSRYERA